MAALTAEERLQRAENTASLLAKINESTGTKNTAQTMQTEYFKNAGVQVDIDSKTNKVKISTTPTSASASSPTVSNDSNTKKQDMQKQKEDRETGKFDAARYKKDQAQKAYDEYVASDEHKQRLEEEKIKRRQEEIMNPVNTNVNLNPIRDEKEEQLRAARDQAEAEYNASEDQKVIEHDLEVITGLSEEERRQLEAYAVGRDVDYYDTMNMAQNGFQMGRAQQKAADLIAKYGQERVDQMANTLSRQNNAQLTQQIAEMGQKHGDMYWGVPGSIASVAANIVGGIMGTMDYMKELGRNDQRFKTLDPNAMGNVGNVYAGAVRGQVQQNIEGDVYDENGELIQDGGMLRGGLSVGYQALMSFLDNVGRAALGGGSLGGTALAATGSFSQTMAEASKRGATPAQAALLATTTAGIEALSEKIPLDNLIRTAKGGTQTVMQMVKTALMQAGIEATTEEISLIGTVLMDAAIMQEKSEYQLSITSKIMQGISPEQARDMANQELIDKVVNTALVSMASGSMSSFGGSAVAQYRQNRAEAMANPAVNKPKNTQQATQAAIENNRARQERMAAEEAAQEAVQPQTEAQPVQKSDGELVQETMANLVRQKQAADAQTEQAPVEVQEEQQAAQTQPETQTETAQQQQQPENTDQEQPAMAQQGSTQQTDVQMGASNQSTEGGQIKGTGAAEQNFTGKAAYQELLQEGNVQRDRPGDVRPVEVPKTDAQGKHVTELAGNAYGSPATPDRMANEIENLIQSGDLSFDRRTNKQSLENAANEISQKGEASIRRSITKNIDSGKVQDGDVEKAILLYTRYANRKSQSSQDNASELLVDLAAMANMTGRNLQLFKLLRRMTPEGQLMAIQKEVRANTEKMIKSGFVKKGFEPVANTELEQEYMKAAKDAKTAKTDKARQEAEASMKELQDAMYLDAAAQMPSTFKAKWDAWRYMAMLGNAKTQVRNFAGNLAFKPYKEVKDKMGALAEKLFVPKDQRTKSLITDQGLIQWARNDRKNNAEVQDALRYSAKLGDDVSTQKTRESMQVFNNKALEGVRKFVEGVPQAGDMLFKSNYYERSLAGFLKARGYTAADIQNGKVSDAVLTEARSYAIQEAMKATFNDSNAFSDFMATELRYKGDNPIGKAINIAAEGVLPFRRTPANIAVRFTEYSPVGVAKGLWNAATKVRNGEMTAATAIDQLSSGLTGSAVMALGFALAGGLNGIKITGSGTDEDEKRQGHQDYALEFSVDGQEYSYKIDWAAPANLPLFVGANIYSALENAGEDTDVSKFTSFIRGMGTMFEPLLALSCMSSLNDLVEGVRYAEEGEALYSMAANAATSYFTQGIPALARQAYQASQENKQTTFASSNDPTLRDMQTTAAGIPFVGAKYQADKINAWGEKENMGDGVTRAVNAFLNPGTLKKIDNSAVEQEITRLNKVQEESVTPPYIPKTITYTDSNGDLHKDYRLSEEEYTKIATTQGQTAKEILDKMFETKGYQAMDDGMKATAVKMAYKYAREKAMKETLGTNYSTSWMLGLSKGTEANKILMEVADNALNSALSNINTARENNYSKENIAAYERKLDEAYTSFKGMPQAQKAKIMESATGDTKIYLHARGQGISHEKTLTTMKKVDDSGTKQKQKMDAIAKQSTLTEEQKVTMAKLYGTDTQDKNIDEVKALGYDFKMYTELYRDHEDYTKGYGKKNRTMAHWREKYGFDRKTAKALYEVFS